jgi:hypothetical protein
LRPRSCCGRVAKLLKEAGLAAAGSRYATHEIMGKPFAYVKACVRDREIMTREGKA